MVVSRRETTTTTSRSSTSSLVYTNRSRELIKKDLISFIQRILRSLSISG